MSTAPQFDIAKLDLIISTQIVWKLR